jgi:hypothetical protein
MDWHSFRAINKGLGKTVKQLSAEYKAQKSVQTGGYEQQPEKYTLASDAEIDKMMNGPSKRPPPPDREYAMQGFDIGNFPANYGMYFYRLRLEPTPSVKKRDSKLVKLFFFDPYPINVPNKLATMYATLNEANKDSVADWYLNVFDMQEAIDNWDSKSHAICKHRLDTARNRIILDEMSEMSKLFSARAKIIAGGGRAQKGGAMPDAEFLGDPKVLKFFETREKLYESSIASSAKAAKTSADEIKSASGEKYSDFMDKFALQMRWEKRVLDLHPQLAPLVEAIHTRDAEFDKMYKSLSDGPDGKDYEVGIEDYIRFNRSTDIKARHKRYFSPGTPCYSKDHPDAGKPGMLGLMDKPPPIADVDVGHSILAPENYKDLLEKERRKHAREDAENAAYQAKKKAAKDRMNQQRREYMKANPYA